MESFVIPHGNARLAVHRHGSGPLAVLLHGYPLDHRMWLDLLQGPLAAQRSLCAIDLRGHGQSPYCGDLVHSMELFADDAAAVIRSLSDDPVDVIGLSMGGYVAQELLHQHPDLVRSLVLANTRAAADDEAAGRARLAAMQQVVDGGRPALAQTMLPKLLAPRPAAAAEALRLRGRLQTMIEAQPVETILADLQGLRSRADQRPRLASFCCPILCIAGAADQITPTAELRELAATLPDGRCIELPDCGHLTPMEDPAGFQSAVAAFYAS